MTEQATINFETTVENCESEDTIAPIFFTIDITEAFDTVSRNAVLNGLMSFSQQLG